MAQLSILKFKPILKSIVWGGRNMSTALNRTLPGEDPYGESWEISDLPGNQSIVSSGEFAGRTIESMLNEHCEEMLGAASLLEGRFPLLFKFIDAQNTLSVQVHPDADACRQLKGGARPKTEAWYIIDARPGASLYVGLKDGVSRAQFESALSAGTVAELLHRMPVTRGNYVFLPSGTVHAIGEGILLAEVQQSSNTTYRVFDWNRAGFDGQPRALHIDEALASIHFNESGVPIAPKPVSGNAGVRCEYFSMETVALSHGQSASFSSEGPVVVMCTAGNGMLRVTANGMFEKAALGETLFIPACIADAVNLTVDGELEMVVTLIPSDKS